MNTKILILAIVAGLFFVSCKKEEIKMPDTMNVTVSTSGSLKVKVADNSSNGIANANVSVSLAGSYTIHTGKTDNSRYYNVSNLLEGVYSCKAEAIVNNVIYSELIYFQIIKDKENSINLLPLSNVGDMKIYAQNYSNNPVPGISLGVIPMSLSSNDISNLSFSEIQAMAIQTATTGTNGLATFTGLPVASYWVLAYRNETNYEIVNYIYSVSKNSVSTFTLNTSI